MFKDRQGAMSTLVLVVVFVVVLVIIGGLIYLDSTGKLFENKNNTQMVADNTQDNSAPEEQQQVNFVPYESPDGEFSLQIPDFWTGQERNGAILFYSYDPAQAEPEQRAKIEIGRAPNPDEMTASEWVQDEGLNPDDAQQATFTPVQGLMFIEQAENDITSTIYVPANQKMYVVTAQSFGGSGNAAVQFFNAILNSWQWSEDVTSPSMIGEETSQNDDTETYSAANWELTYPTDWQVSEENDQISFRSNENASLPLTVEVMEREYTGSLADWLDNRYQTFEDSLAEAENSQNPYLPAEEMNQAELSSQTAYQISGVTADNYTTTEIYSLYNGQVYKLSYPDSHETDPAFAEKSVTFIDIANSFNWQ